jgi:hypothetical protein
MVIQNGTRTSLKAVHPVCLSPCAWKASTPKYVVALPFLVGIIIMEFFLFLGLGQSPRRR